MEGALGLQEAKAGAASPHGGWACNWHGTILPFLMGQSQPELEEKWDNPSVGGGQECSHPYLLTRRASEETCMASSHSKFHTSSHSLPIWGCVTLGVLGFPGYAAPHRVCWATWGVPGSHGACWITWGMLGSHRACWGRAVFHSHPLPESVHTTQRWEPRKSHCRGCVVCVCVALCGIYVCETHTSCMSCLLISSLDTGGDGILGGAFLGGKDEWFEHGIAGHVW